MTGGDDTLVKAWDYDATRPVPYYYQAFIGHTYAVSQVMFNPCDQSQIITIGDQDGIYVWQFHGDTQTNYHPESGGQHQ